IDDFIHPFSKDTKQIFLNICTVLKKPAILGLQLGELGPHLLPELWASLEVKVQE
uniref:Uncharacterized protein n=1 Tax=Nomascus leucogenys TaxID=61853 RepID=A0A2I3G3P7_NOMLE